MADFLNDSSSLFEFVANQGHGIKGLVDLGIKEVPKLYIQPPHERSKEITNPSLNSDLSVPIDLSKLDGPEHEEVVNAIVRASEKTGFFQVINHGLDMELLQSVKAAAYRFFAQPAEAKAVYLLGKSPSPFVKFSTSFSPGNEKVLEWRDYMNLIYINDEDAEKYWPMACKEEMLQYMRLSSKLVTKLFQILVGNLGVRLEESRMESLIGSKAVNMNFYPPCPNPELTIGAKSHSDSGILTVLLQDDIRGLYAKAEEEEWIEVPPISGALVINVGDLLQVLSNGRYKSAEHRVITTRDKSRVSIPLFVSARQMEKIGPVPELVERDGGTLYREFVAGDYFKNFLVRGHDGKKQLEFAKLNYVP